jgi:hypothetical protein
MNNKGDNCRVSSERSGYGVPALAGYAYRYAWMPEISFALEVAQPAKAGTPYPAGDFDPTHSPLDPRPSPLAPRPFST